MIALIGAECTGKTTLARALASRLQAVFVPELLRGWCDRMQRTPRADEQAALVQAQIAQEQEALAQAHRQGSRWLLIDSTPLITALYSEHLFGDRSLLAQAVAHQRSYALTLLTQPDPVWEADGVQRDGPQARQAFHEHLLRAMGEHGVSHRRVAGPPEVRLETVLAWVAALDVVLTQEP